MWESERKNADSTRHSVQQFTMHAFPLATFYIHRIHSSLVNFWFPSKYSHMQRWNTVQIRLCHPIRSPIVGRKKRKGKLIQEVTGSRLAFCPLLSSAAYCRVRKRNACLFTACCFRFKGWDGDDEAMISGPMFSRCSRSYWVTDSLIGCTNETPFLAPIRFSLCSGLKMWSTDELV